MSKYEKEYYEIKSKMGEYIRYLIQEYDLKKEVAYQLTIDFMPMDDDEVEWWGETLLENLEVM